MSDLAYIVIGAAIIMVVVWYMRDENADENADESAENTEK